MICEVLMDLLQPEIMSRIVDEGVLGTNTGGVGDMQLIWTLGLQMIILVIFGGLCGSMNNVFVHLTGQNIGNEIRTSIAENIAWGQPGADVDAIRAAANIAQAADFIESAPDGDERY